MENSYFNQLDVFKSYLVQGAKFSPVYEFPMLSAVDYKPCKAIPFEKASKSTDINQWVHFYTYDRQFECVWNTPKRYLSLFRRFLGVITPDFSLYREMPLAYQIWNTYRNRVLAYWLQSQGVKIVPNVRWGDARTYKFAFEGLPVNSTVAVGTVGSLQNRIDRAFFKNGLTRMVERLCPTTIISYGGTPDDVFGDCKLLGINIIKIPHFMCSLASEVL